MLTINILLIILVAEFMLYIVNNVSTSSPITGKMIINIIVRMVVIIAVFLKGMGKL